MKPSIYSRLAVLLLLSVPFIVHAEPETPALQTPAFQTVVQDRNHGNFLETEWRLTFNDQEAIGLHHYRDPAATSRAVVLYLPGTNMNGTLKTPGLRNNLWLFLAASGIEVFAMDYRTRFVSADFEGDLAFMREWTMEQFVDDAETAAARVREVRPDMPLFVAGFSRGVNFAYALSGRLETHGLILLDGGFKEMPPEPVDLAALLRQFDEEKNYATVLSRRGEAARTDLMQRVIDDPDGTPRDDSYDSAADHLKAVLYNAWGPGVLSNTQDDVSDIAVLAREMIAYDWFYPSIQYLQHRSLRNMDDDPATSLDDHWGDIEAPIIYFGTANMGASVLVSDIYSAGRSGSKDVTIHVLENYGHLDVLFAKDAYRTVFRPVTNWILERTGDTDEAP